jgi:NAD(P)-dependent dehydrogenase (short-subunit alcohol dehydrogenase family)
MKHILITGGTGGIGRHISKALVEAGNHVMVWGNSPELAEEVQKQITKNQDNVSFQTIDVSDQAQVASALKQVEKLDVLINAAAVLWPVKLFLDTNLVELKKAIEINLLGTVYTCYHALPLLQKSSQGKVINFGGGGAADGRQSHMAYSISKTAVVRLTENLVLDHPWIDANVIAPGAHKTAMWQEEKFDQEPEKWGDMEQLIEFFNFLVSDASNGVRGKFIHYKDDWKKPEVLEKIKTDNNFLTLRRIDGLRFQSL